MLAKKQKTTQKKCKKTNTKIGSKIKYESQKSAIVNERYKDEDRQFRRSL